MSFATLRALHALIGAALDDIEAVYTAASADDSLPTYGLPSPLSPSPTGRGYMHSPPPGMGLEAEGVDGQVVDDSSGVGDGDVHARQHRDGEKSMQTREAALPSPLSAVVSHSPAPYADSLAPPSPFRASSVASSQRPSAPHTAYPPAPHARTASCSSSSLSSYSASASTASSRAPSRAQVLLGAHGARRGEVAECADGQQQGSEDFSRSAYTHAPASDTRSLAHSSIQTSTSARRTALARFFPLSLSRRSTASASVLVSPPSTSTSHSTSGPQTPKSAIATGIQSASTPQLSLSAALPARANVPSTPQRHQLRQSLASSPDVRLPSTPRAQMQTQTSVTPRSAGVRVSMGTGTSHRAAEAGADPEASPSPIRFAPNPHGEGTSAESEAVGMPGLLEATAGWASPATPTRAPTYTDALATPTSASMHPRAGEDSPWRRQRHRPTPLLPALSLTPKPANTVTPPTPASLFDAEARRSGDGEGMGTVLGAAWEERPGRARERTRTRVLDWPALDEPVYAFARGEREDGKEEEGPREYIEQEKKSGVETETEEERNRALSEALTTHPAVLAAVARLVAACGQLCAGVQRPFLTVCDATMGYHLPACMRLLEAAHVPEILREAGPGGMHVKEITKRVGEVRRANRRAAEGKDGDKGGEGREKGESKGENETDYGDAYRARKGEEDVESDRLEVDPVLLSHVLRLLATHHITREVRPDVFANNRISGAVDSGKSLKELGSAPETKYEGTDGIAAFVGLCSDELFKSAAYLADCYLPPLQERDHSLGAGRVSSSSSMDDAPGEGAAPRSSLTKNELGTPSPSDHADLADLALGRTGSPRPPLKSKRSFLGSASPSSEEKRRPRALSIKPPSSNSLKTDAPKRPRALSIIPSSSLRSNAAAAGHASPTPLTPLSATPAPSEKNSCADLQSGTKPDARSQTDRRDAGDMNNPMHAPFNLAFRTKAPYFEWLEGKGNAARLRRFGRAMTGTGAWEVPGAIVGGFPWHSLPPSALVVDVGGGIGSTSMLLAHAFPQLKFLVQDRPQVVKMGEAAWRERCPQLLDSGRAAFQAHDFFTPQPPTPVSLRTGPLTSTSDQADTLTDQTGEHSAPAVFLLRVITHDWPDAILLHLRRAAGPDTKLLLADYVLPLACIDEDIEPDSPRENCQMTEKIKADPIAGAVRSLAPEGSPLLPNLGKASANAYWLDLTMRATFNAQERTLRELITLTQTAGWRIVQVTRSDSSLFGYITAVPIEVSPESLALLDTPLPGTVVESTGKATGSKTQVTVTSPPMGDTFCSFVDLPSDDVVRKGVRASKRAGAGATQGWQARASEWKQRLVKKGSAIWKDRKSMSQLASPGPAPPPPMPPTPFQLLPALEVASEGKRAHKSMGRSPSAGTNTASSEGLREGPRGLRKMLSRAQLSSSGDRSGAR